MLAELTTRPQTRPQAQERATVTPAVAAARAREAALVARLRAGDPGAFDAVYHEYHRPIGNYVATRLGSGYTRALTDDLTQDVFTRAWIKLPAVLARDGECRLAAWLYRVATNIVYDHQRHHGLVAFERLSWFTTLPAHSRYHESVLAPVDDWPLQRLAERHETQAEVRAVLDAIGARGGTHAKYRLCLVLREYHELSYDEIAAVMGTTRAATKSLLFRARQTFAALWGQTHAQERTTEGVPA